MTIVVHLTPEEAMQLATNLMARAKRVNEVKQRVPDAYDYFTVGHEAVQGVKNSGDKIRVRIGDERL